jgi:hypothetical protein
MTVMINVLVVVIYVIVVVVAVVVVLWIGTQLRYCVLVLCSSAVVLIRFVADAARCSLLAAAPPIVHWAHERYYGTSTLSMEEVLCRCVYYNPHQTPLQVLHLSCGCTLVVGTIGGDVVVTTKRRYATHTNLFGYTDPTRREHLVRAEATTKDMHQQPADQPMKDIEPRTLVACEHMNKLGSSTVHCGRLQLLRLLYDAPTWCSSM